MNCWFNWRSVRLAPPASSCSSRQRWAQSRAEDSRWLRSSVDSGPAGLSTSTRRRSSRASKRDASSSGTLSAVHDPPANSQRRDAAHLLGALELVHLPLRDQRQRARPELDRLAVDQVAAASLADPDQLVV